MVIMIKDQVDGVLILELNVIWDIYWICLKNTLLPKVVRRRLESRNAVGSPSITLDVFKSDMFQLNRTFYLIFKNLCHDDFATFR